MIQVTQTTEIVFDDDEVNEMVKHWILHKYKLQIEEMDVFVERNEISVSIKEEGDSLPL